MYKPTWKSVNIKRLIGMALAILVTLWTRTSLCCSMLHHSLAPCLRVKVYMVEASHINKHERTSKRSKITACSSLF